MHTAVKICIKKKAKYSLKPSKTGFYIKTLLK